jgi:hypothetical protein
MTIAEIEEKIPEQRTHAIRSLLNYFARVYEYQKLGLTDRKVTAELFREPWLWWGHFFLLLKERVEGHLRARGLPESEWAAHSFISSLNRVAALAWISHRRIRIGCLSGRRYLCHNNLRLRERTPDAHTV